MGKRGLIIFCLAFLPALARGYLDCSLVYSKMTAEGLALIADKKLSGYETYRGVRDEGFWSYFERRENEKFDKGVAEIDAIRRAGGEIPYINQKVRGGVQYVIEKIKGSDFYKEVREEGVKRLFVKKPHDYDPKYKYIFLKEENVPVFSLHSPISSITMLPFRFPKLFGSKYELAPLSGPAHYLMVKPFQAVAKKLTGKNLKPAILLHLLPGLFDEMSLALLAAGIAMDKHEEEKERRATEACLKMLIFDVNYWDLEKKMREEEIPILEICKQVEERAQEEIGTSNILAHEDFKNVRRFHEKGVPTPNKPFLIATEDFKTKLSPEQLDQLIALHRDLYGVKRMLELIAVDSPLIRAWEKEAEQTKRVSNEVELIRAIRSDPFFQKLTGYKRAGRITDEQYLHFLKEDATWRARLQEYPILGIVRLRIKNKVIQEEVLTMEHMQREFIVEDLGITE